MKYLSDEPIEIKTIEDLNTFKSIHGCQKIKFICERCNKEITKSYMAVRYRGLLCTSCQKFLNGVKRFGSEELYKLHLKDKTQRAHKTLLEKYGSIENIRSIFLLKYRQTCLAKYGVDNFSKTEKRILEMKYNNPMFNKEIKQKAINNYNHEKHVIAANKTAAYMKENNLYSLRTLKIKETKLQRYANPGFVNHDKAVQTMLERYGIDCGFKHENCYNSIILKYGSLYEFYLQRAKLLHQYMHEHVEDGNNVYKIIYNSRSKNFGIDAIKAYLENISANNLVTVSALSDLLNVHRDTIIHAITDLCIDTYLFGNRKWLTVSKELTDIIELQVIYRKTHILSKGEHEIYEYLQNILENNHNILFHDRVTIAPKELDIHIVDKKFAIEYDGCWWHKNDNTLNKKILLCHDKDILLIRIFDTEWINKRDTCTSIIKRKLHIDTLSCKGFTLQNIDSKTFKNFLDTNSLYTIGYLVFETFGLFYKDELYEVFNINKKEGMLICRCQKNGVNIIDDILFLLNLLQLYFMEAIYITIDNRFENICDYILDNNMTYLLVENKDPSVIFSYNNYNIYDCGKTVYKINLE